MPRASSRSRTSGVSTSEPATSSTWTGARAAAARPTGPLAESEGRQAQRLGKVVGQLVGGADLETPSASSYS